MSIHSKIFSLTFTKGNFHFAICITFHLTAKCTNLCITYFVRLRWMHFMCSCVEMAQYKLYTY